MVSVYHLQKRSSTFDTLLLSRFEDPIGVLAPNPDDLTTTAGFYFIKRKYILKNETVFFTIRRSLLM